MMIESHSVWPLQGALPVIRALNACEEVSRATERETTSAVAFAPLSVTI